jgi:hypothetical protein
MPGRGRPTHEQTTEALWTQVLGFPLFLPFMVVATFLGVAREGPWRVWLVRTGMSLFFWLVAWSVAVPRLRELGRRGTWLPPGLQRWPVLASGGYVAAVMLAAAVAWAGIGIGLPWALQSSGLIVRRSARAAGAGMTRGNDRSGSRQIDVDAHTARPDPVDSAREIVPLGRGGGPPSIPPRPVQPSPRSGLPAPGPIQFDRTHRAGRSASGLEKPCRPAYRRNKSDATAILSLTRISNLVEFPLVPQGAAIISPSARERAEPERAFPGATTRRRSRRTTADDCPHHRRRSRRD